MVEPIHIIGRKNSGKTTLVVDLVRHLSEAGYRVATIKHTHHHHELDTPGKDSFCHREAGAIAVGILAPKMSALFRPNIDDQSDERRYEAMLNELADCDVVLVEGDSQSPRKKIEVWRLATGSEPMVRADDSILAVVTDDPIETTKPVWPRSDVRQLATRVLELAGVSSSGGTPL